MSIRDSMKNKLPAYRTERRLHEQIERLHNDIKETNKKNEFMFWMSQMQPGETMQETKQRVFLSMPKATGRLRNIQLAENFILRCVKHICDENGLQLFLMGGTLLGAIRHKGFIPWDNDVDVGMMQSDFDKLEALLKDDELLTLHYTYNYEAGLRIAKVQFKENDVFWIDIFTFDYVDAEKETADEVWKMTQQMNRVFGEKLRELTAPYAQEKHCRLVANPDIDEKAKTEKEKLLTDKAVFGHGKYFCETIDNPNWCRDPRGIMPAEEYLPMLKDEVEFEGEKYDTLNNYEKALEHFFGDYWELPFSISEPHTTQFDEGLEEAFEYIRKIGVIE